MRFVYICVLNYLFAKSYDNEDFDVDIDGYVAADAGGRAERVV